MTELSKILEEVTSAICDKYCKWPGIYDGKNASGDYEEMLEEKCSNCPLNRIY